MTGKRSIPHALRGTAAAVAFLACWLVALSLLTALLHPAITGTLSGNPAQMRLALELLSLASVAVPTVLFARLRPPAEPWTGALVASGLGAVFGLFWLGGALGANWLAGNLSVGPAHPAAHLAIWAAASLLLTELRLLTGGLAVSVAAHFAWNAAGGIGLGVVALADDYPHALSLSVGDGASLSAGAMGIEGSPWTLLVTAAICVALALKLQKSGGA